LLVPWAAFLWIGVHPRIANISMTIPTASVIILAKSILCPEIFDLEYWRNEYFR
jgi:hypothetical protein